MVVASANGYALILPICMVSLAVLAHESQTYGYDQIYEGAEQHSPWKRDSRGNRMLQFYGPSKRERIVMDALGGDFLIRKRQLEQFIPF